MFLAVITKVMKPRSFHKVVKDPKCREVMEIEIEALELNKT